MKKRILVVDDEPRIRRFVRMNLELEGYDVFEAADGLAALDKVREDLPDLVLLDVMMPNLDGFETLARVREFSQVPVIILTAKGDEEDLTHGLDLGADDYITKPFSPRVLSSRIRAVLRRIEPTPGQSQEPLVIDQDLSIDFPRREVIARGQRVKLRPTEYRLLLHLVENAGWILPHETLLSKVWGPEYRDDSQLLRLYITYLRQKIEPDPANPRYILTERGVGYRFVDYKKELQAKAGQG
ncbi:MAG TPA: response regulator transcription factor [Anaerolineae bacterium]